MKDMRFIDMQEMRRIEGGDGEFWIEGFLIGGSLGAKAAKWIKKQWS